MRTTLSATLFAGLLAGMAEAINLDLSITDEAEIVEIWDQAACSGNKHELEMNDGMTAGRRRFNPLRSIGSAEVPSGSRLVVVHTIEDEEDEWGWPATFRFEVEGDDAAGCIDLIDLAEDNCEDEMGADYGCSDLDIKIT